MSACAHNGAYRRVSAACLLTIVSTAAPAAASADTPPHLSLVSAAPPAGFEDLAQPQRAVIDIYFGGRRLGQTEAVFAPGQFRFLNPEALVAMLPDLLDRMAVRDALAAPTLDPNAALACGADDARAACGRLDPAVAGIIFDQRRFRVDLFVNQRFQAVRPALAAQYLTRPDAGLSLVDAIGATIAGTGGEAPTYNLQNRAILGNGDARIRSELSYSSDFGLLSDVLVAEVDKPGWRYSLGAFWAPGIEMIGRRKIIGAGIETQFDTRLDRDLVEGSPLIVFLSQRAQVDILRDGRLLVSRVYDAGNQSLDTSGLPEGSYDIVLRIQDAGGVGREERRFFSKNRRIAPMGRSLVTAFAGVLAEDRPGALLSATGTPFVQAGIAHRIAPSLALDTTLLATDRKALVEVGGYMLTRQVQLRAAALGSSTGDYGLLAQLNSSGRGALNFNVDVRVISSRDGGPLLPTSVDVARARSFVSPDATTGQLSSGSYGQMVGSVTYRLGPAQFGVLGSYRRQAKLPASYAVGPSVRWPLLQRQGLEWAVSGDFALSDRGRSGFVGISLRKFGARSSYGATAGMRSSAQRSDGARAGAVGGIQGSWQRQDVLGGDVNAAAALERDLDSTQIGASAGLRNRFATASLDLVRRLDQPAGTQYGLAVQSGFAVRGGAVAVEGRDRNDSMVIVTLDDAPADTRFDIFVNDAPRGTVRGGGSLAIALPPYRGYAVRIRPTGGALLRYDGTPRRISLYPGTVARLSWSAAPVVALFGRALWPDGSPIEDADVSAHGDIAQTDGKGYFLIETPLVESLSIRAADGRSCHLALGKVAPVNDYAALGSLTCAAIDPDDTPAHPTAIATIE